MNAYLWVNLADLGQLGSMPIAGTPLNLLINPEFGDRMLPGYFTTSKRMDEACIVVETTPERTTIIKDALELISQRKMGRKLRTKITKTPPRNA